MPGPRHSGALARTLALPLTPVAPAAQLSHDVSFRMRPASGAGGGRKRYSWAELLRIWLIDILVCPRCSGKRGLLAAIHDPDAIARRSFLGR